MTDDPKRSTPLKEDDLRVLIRISAIDTTTTDLASLGDAMEPVGNFVARASHAATRLTKLGLLEPGDDDHYSLSAEGHAFVAQIRGRDCGLVMPPVAGQGFMGRPCRQQALRLEEIDMSPAASARARLDESVVERYASDMTDGMRFPPLLVFFDGTTYWGWEGRHRWQAAQKVELTVFDCIVAAGNEGEARLAAKGANAKHGLPLTNEDKWNNVASLLDEPTMKTRTLREIAELCGVSHSFVRKVREMATGAPSPSLDGDDMSPPSSATTDPGFRIQSGASGANIEAGAKVDDTEDIATSSEPDAAAPVTGRPQRVLLKRQLRRVVSRLSNDCRELQRVAAEAAALGETELVGEASAALEQLPRALG